MDRKQFIKTFARTTILAGMAGMVAVFVKRESIGTVNTCSIDFQCGRCKTSKSCILPEAINHRENGKG